MIEKGDITIGYTRFESYLLEMDGIVAYQFDIWSALLAFGVFLGVFMIFILFSYGRSRSIHYLTCLLLVLVLILSEYLLASSNLYRLFPHLLYSTIPLFFLIGPLYYGYVRSVVGPGNVLRWRELFHFVPFIICIIILLPFYQLEADQKVVFIDNQKAEQLIPFALGTFLFIASQLAHSLIYIYKANENLTSLLNSGKRTSESKRLIWLKGFGIVFLMYWTTDLLVLVFYLFKGEIHQEAFYITMLGSVILINTLVYFAIRHSVAFGQSLIPVDKYKNSVLSASDYDSLTRKIVQVMQEEKPYLDTDMSLTKLASLTGVSTHQVSQVLNNQLGKSFYEFINEYRYEEAKSRLRKKEYQHLTILAIALESGFNNKNTFNKVFKKHAGVTPSEYQKLEAS